HCVSFSPKRLQQSPSEKPIFEMITSDSMFIGASPSKVSGASMRVGINCLDINPSFVGGVTTYALGLLEGFAAVGNECRFRAFVTRENRHLFASFQKRDNFEIFVINDSFFSARVAFCKATFLSYSRGFHKFASGLVLRSEERRVGKECRWRGS